MVFTEVILSLKKKKKYLHIQKDKINQLTPEIFLQFTKNHVEKE